MFAINTGSLKILIGKKCLERTHQPARGVVAEIALNSRGSGESLHAGHAIFDQTFKVQHGRIGVRVAGRTGKTSQTRHTGHIHARYGTVRGTEVKTYCIETHVRDSLRPMALFAHSRHASYTTVKYPIPAPEL